VRTATRRWYAENYPDAAPLLDAAGVRAFLADLREAGQRPGTLRLRYSALRLFGKWLASEGELDADPLVSMSPPKLDRPLVHAVADAEVTALLHACEGKAFADKRDTALVRLLVSTGMRAGEALSLTTGSVDPGAPGDHRQARQGGQGPDRAAATGDRDGPRRVPPRSQAAPAGEAQAAVAG
jgi:site-specific recombinase XerD